MHTYTTKLYEPYQCRAYYVLVERNSLYRLSVIVLSCLIELPPACPISSHAATHPTIHALWVLDSILTSLFSLFLFFVFLANRLIGFHTARCPDTRASPRSWRWTLGLPRGVMAGAATCLRPRGGIGRYGRCVQYMGLIGVRFWSLCLFCRRAFLAVFICTTQ